MSEEGFVDSGEDSGMMASPAAPPSRGGSSLLSSAASPSAASPSAASPSASSASPGIKRKRAMAMRGGEEAAEEAMEAANAAAAAAAAVADEEIRKLKEELAAERTR